MHAEFAAQFAGKVICFHCRRTGCSPPCLAAIRRPLSVPLDAIAYAGIWLAGACVAGSALGVGLALLCSG